MVSNALSQWPVPEKNTIVCSGRLTSSPNASPGCRLSGRDELSWAGAAAWAAAGATPPAPSSTRADTAVSIARRR